MGGRGGAFHCTILSLIQVVGVEYLYQTAFAGTLGSVAVCVPLFSLVFLVFLLLLLLFFLILLSHSPLPTCLQTVTSSSSSYSSSSSSSSSSSFSFKQPSSPFPLNNYLSFLLLLKVVHLQVTPPLKLLQTLLLSEALETI